MYIETDCENFIPSDFVIVNFYGKETCFAWDENEFIYFPYTYKDSTEKLKLLKAPAKIKDIRGFNERIFILCYPNGIYKFTDNSEFASLSKAGVELGTDFCEVFTPNNGMLILEDKKLKCTKKLFATLTTSEIHVLPLSYDNTNRSLCKILLAENYSSNANMCIISHDKKLFKMSNQTIQIIYNCDYLIKGIKSVEKNKEVIGAILETDSNIVILMHVLENKLKYDKIFLESNVRIVCAVPDMRIDNSLLLIHSDELRTYYSRKMINEDTIQKIKTEEKNYNRIRLYQSKFIIYLNDFKEIFQIPIEQLNIINQNTSNYVKLDLNMLQGLESMFAIISDKSIQLKKLQEEIIQKEDQLKRINIFVSKQQLKYCPKDSVERLMNNIFLVSNFERVLPQNTIIVKMIKSRGKAIFAMKNVKDYDTVIKIPICIPNLSSNLYITTDLITYKNDGQIWCLIKNYINDPTVRKRKSIHLTAEKIKFIKYKLFLLKTLIEERNISMQALVKIKREVREELSSITP